MVWIILTLIMLFSLYLSLVPFLSINNPYLCVCVCVMIRAAYNFVWFLNFFKNFAVNCLVDQLLLISYCYYLLAYWNPSQKPLPVFAFWPVSLTLTTLSFKCSVRTYKKNLFWVNFELNVKQESHFILSYVDIWFPGTINNEAAFSVM